MTPNFAPMQDWAARTGGEYDVDESTVRPVGEGVWFAWRTSDHGRLDVRNGVWWTHSGSRIVSLATGSDLHSWKSVDFETYMFVPDEDPHDVCCHATFDEAEACALGAMSSGQWCEPREREESA